MTRPMQILFALVLLAGSITGCSDQHYSVSPQGDDPGTATQLSESANAEVELTVGRRLAKLAAANCLTNVFPIDGTHQVYDEGAMRYEATKGNSLTILKSNMVIDGPGGTGVIVRRSDGEPFTLQSLDVVSFQGGFQVRSSTETVTVSPKNDFPLTLALPASGFSGITEFSMEISGKRGGSVTIDNVVICSDNQPPVANAGSDQTAIVGDTAQLDGSGSSDPDAGDILTYSWTISDAPAGSAAMLVGANTATPSLSPDIPGDYTVELVVNDGTVDSPADQVIITAVTPGEAVQNLSGLIVGLELPGGVQKSLTAPLKTASKVLSDNNTSNDVAACRKLDAFIKQVGAKEKKGKLSQAQADQLRQAVGTIKNSLGC